jgi:addiction module RelB/DinJ family antitoxin
MTSSADNYNDVRVTIRVNKDLKERAEILFDRLGMNMSTALNIFLRKAVYEEAIPFTISVKSTLFGSCHASDNPASTITAAEQNDTEKNQQNKSQIVQPDKKVGNTRLEPPDVSCEYVNRYGKPIA